MDQDFSELLNIFIEEQHEIVKLIDNIVQSNKPCEPYMYLQDTLIDKCEEIENLEKRLTYYVKLTQELKKSLHNKDKIQSNLETQLKNCEYNKNLLEENIKKLQDKNIGLQAKLETQNHEIEELEGLKLQLINSENKNKNLLKQMNMLNKNQIQEITKFNSILESRCREKTILEQQLNCLREYVTHLDLAGILQDISQKEDRCMDLALELEICKSDRNLLKEELNKAKMYIKELVEYKQEIQSSTQNIEDQISCNNLNEMNVLNKNCEYNKNLLEENIKKLQDSNFGLQVKLKTLNHEIEELQGLKLQLIEVNRRGIQ